MHVSAERLAQEASQIEIDILGEPIGKQDQYAAAYGGFNLIEFKPDDSVVVSPVICERATMLDLEANILVFYTGITRSASTVLKQQAEEIRGNADKQKVLARMASLAYALREELHRNNTAAMGEILHENWMLKKSVTRGVSTAEIDAWYDAARRAGASGGKLLGAGGGGFLMLYAPKDAHERIKAALHMLRPVGVGFEPLGSRIIFYH